METVLFLGGIIVTAAVFIGMLMIARDSGKPEWKLEQDRARRKRDRQDMWRDLTR